jgi:hypothetical protein
MKPKSILVTSWMLAFYLCAFQTFVSVALSEETDVKRYTYETGIPKQEAAINETDVNAVENPDPNSSTDPNFATDPGTDSVITNPDPNSVNNQETTSGTNPETNNSPPIDIGSNILTGISITSAVLTILEGIDRRILPQPTTALDILDSVRRLEDLIRPNDEGQYKKAEDTISRALYDMGVMMAGVGRQGTIESSAFQELLWLERARLIDGNIILLMEGLLGQPVAGADIMENIQNDLKVNSIFLSETDA